MHLASAITDYGCDSVQLADDQKTETARGLLIILESNTSALPLGNCIGVKCDETIPTVKRDWFGDDEHKVAAFRPRLPEESVVNKTSKLDFERLIDPISTCCWSTSFLLRVSSIWIASLRSSSPSGIVKASVLFHEPRTISYFSVASAGVREQATRRLKPCGDFGIACFSKASSCD